jgi:hypothetical protein
LLTSISAAQCSALIFLGLLIGAPGAAWAQTFQDGNAAVEITDGPMIPPRSANTKSNRGFAPRVGRQAAAKYMAPKKPGEGTEEETVPTETRKSSGYSAGASDHYLAVHVGWFANDNAYKWGAAENQENVGRYNFGITYRMGEWINSMDLLFRFDVARMALAEGSVTKFSIIPLVTFPDASSRFPLYFGAGIGLGAFGSQIAGESALSLDYQLIAGARFFNLWGQTGLFVEGGIKNHIHLLSDGQFNGTFIATGLVFTF